MLKGFRDFMLKGNVIDLAVAVIIGAMFTAIVDSLVKGVIDPTLAAVVGKPNFDDAVNVGPAKIGMVITAIVNFLLKGAVVYFFIVAPAKAAMEKFKKEAPPAEPSAQEKLLTEIRDLLKKQAAKD